MEKFEDKLPNKSRCMMASTHLIHQAPLNDAIIQGETSNDLFFTKSAYELAQKKKNMECIMLTGKLFSA